MSGVTRIRVSAFAPFAGCSLGTLKVHRYAGTLPFEMPDRGHMTFGPAEHLAWALVDHLVYRHCLVRRSAAAAVRCSSVAERFLEDLGHGDDVSYLCLAIWSEAGDPDGQRWVSVMQGVEVAALRQSGAGAQLICHRLSGDTWDPAYRAPQNVAGVLSVGVLGQWRVAVERARRAGLDLRPGSVRLLSGHAFEQERKPVSVGAV